MRSRTVSEGFIQITAAARPMHALRFLGVALIVFGILFGASTFVFLSYGILTAGRDEMFWFWQGPVIGAFVSILGAVLAVLPHSRGRHRTIP
jgi:hypothetical protein